MARKTVQPMKHESTHAAVYLRVSTDEQAAGYGLDVQLERCKAMAVAKGLTLAPEHIFSDAGISGTKDETERPQLAALLAAVESGRVDTVIVLALDRLARKTRIVLNLVDRISRVGASLVSCKESLDTSTPAGQFVLTIFAALAQLERDTIVERTTAGRNQRGKVDGERGGRLPFGYVRRQDGRIDIDPFRAALVKMIFTWRPTSTLREIAARLNEAGHVGPRGGKWYHSSIAEIVNNEPVYHGGQRNDSPIAWPAIL